MKINCYKNQLNITVTLALIHRLRYREKMVFTIGIINIFLIIKYAYIQRRAI